MKYRVHISETAEAEIDAAYLWFLRQSPGRAARWHADLLEAIESLSAMPGRCPLARERDRFDRDVRQLLSGRGRHVYRILYLVIEPQAADEEPLVRILHVRHASRRALGE